MMYHCYLDWDFGDEPTDEVVAEVVKGLKCNKAHNGGGYYTPDAYAPLTAVDSFIYHIGKFLDAYEGQVPITEKAIEEFIQRAPESGGAIVRKAIAELRK